jgi:branched-chain amino acid transport system permease protein
MGLSPYVGFPLAFLLGGGMSIVIFLLVINVLQRIGGGAIVLTISTLAIQIFLTAALNIYAYWLREVYHTYSMAFMLKEFDFYIGDYPGVFPVTLILCIVTVILLHYMLTRTRIGVAMRATAEDPELASVLGINIYRVQLFSWFLTGGMACLAGAFLPLWFQSSPTTGAAIITSIMAGSLLGGFENVYGAIVGGFGVGFSEILLTYWLQGVFGSWVGEYRPLIPMFFLIAVLLLEPRGLQGVYERLSATKTGERLIGIFSRGRSVS